MLMLEMFLEPEPEAETEPVIEESGAEGQL